MNAKEKMKKLELVQTIATLIDEDMSEQAKKFYKQYYPESAHVRRYSVFVQAKKHFEKDQTVPHSHHLSDDGTDTILYVLVQENLSNGDLLLQGSVNSALQCLQ